MNTYRAVQAAAQESSPRDFDWLIETHQLQLAATPAQLSSRLRTKLNQTGQTLPNQLEPRRRPRRRCGSRDPLL
ncbi:MAG TPA: hypothetical protein VEH81_11145 [Ktedonobacteraceae bacterium]|nr:hypothetical protein [Ktedonobacteraceae bacterium]